MLIVSTCTPFKDIIKIKETSYSTTDTSSSASHLDIHIETDSESRIKTKSYYKRSDCNFHIVSIPFTCVATFQRHLYIEYISLTSNVIPELVFFYLNFFGGGVANKEAIEPIVPSGRVEVVTSKVLRSPSWLWSLLCNICHSYVPLVVVSFIIPNLLSSIMTYHGIWLITWFSTPVTQQVQLVEQEHFRNLNFTSIFSWIYVT